MAKRAATGAARTTRRRDSTPTRDAPPARAEAGAGGEPSAAPGLQAAANPWLSMWTDLAESMRTASQPAPLPQFNVDTARVTQLQQHYVEQLTGLWREFFEHPEKAAEPIKDNRFADPAWQGNPLASFYARAYLLNADFMNRLADTVETDRKTKRRVKFAVSQFVDAASPSNYLALNP